MIRIFDIPKMGRIFVIADDGSDLLAWFWIEIDANTPDEIGIQKMMDAVADCLSKEDNICMTVSTTMNLFTLDPVTNVNDLVEKVKVAGGMERIIH